MTALIFHWHSRALQRYSYGDVAAVSTTVEGARAIIWRDRLAAFRIDHDYLYNGDVLVDEEDQSQVDAFFAALREDIDAEPAYVGNRLFIAGGE